MGGHAPAVSPEAAEQIQALDGEYHFETYFSLSCQNCPDVVQALNLMSVLNPSITHVAIDGALFQDEVEARGVMAVPTVFLNGEVFDQGRMTLEQIVAKLDSSATEKAAEEIRGKDPFDVLVVGGGPAGVSVGHLRRPQGDPHRRRRRALRRPGARHHGDRELHLGPLHRGPQARRGPRAARLGLRRRRHGPAAGRTPRAGQQADGLLTVELESGATVNGRTVVLSTGARWRHMGVPGEDEYRNKGVTYCPHCDGPLFKGKRVAVIGGGNSGVEAAIDLAGVVAHVTLLEFDGALRADDVLQRKLRSLPNVDVLVSALTTEVLGDGAKVTGLEYEDRSTGEKDRLDVEGVFVQIGLLPNTEWLEDTVELTDRKEIVIDDRGATSVPGVFAAGDCTTVPYKQIVIAMGTGSTAALSAFDHLIRTSAPDEADSPEA